LTSSLLDVRRGSQTPRVSNYPPYATSAAPEAIDLAEYFGLILDGWQRYVLTHALGQRRDGAWTAPKVSCWVPRQNGKGSVIEALELYWLFCSQEELIVHSAHQHRTSQKAYERLERLIRRTPDFHRLVAQYRQANGEQQIELHDGRLLQYTTRSRTAVRGFSANKLILDEAQELTQDQMAAILPTVSAQINWQVYFFGTPPDDPSAWCYGLKEDGEASTPRLAHFDWGAELDLTDPDDRAKVNHSSLWYECNPALGIRIALETVEDENKPSGLGEKFPQERLGHWQPRATTGEGVIGEQLWRDLADASSERPNTLAFAIDVNPARTHGAIVAVGPRSDGLMLAAVVDYRPGTDWIPQRAADLRDRWDPIAIGLDVKGPGGSLLLDLDRFGIKMPEDPDEPQRGDLAVPNAGDAAAAYGLIVDLARQKGLRHLDEAPLNLAVAGAGTRPLAGGSAWNRKGTADICPLVAATVAHWAYVTRVEKVTAEYDPLANIY
jgi:hypothetical protein